MIQSRLRHASLTEKKKTQITRAFARHMFEGNTRAALQLLIGQDRGGVLNLNDPADPSNPEFSVRDTLNAKHPPAQPLHPECLLALADTPAVHPVVFDALDASVVRAAALRTMGVAGPSGIDARGWRRLCTSFRAASDELCGAIALFARQLCMYILHFSRYSVTIFGLPAHCFGQVSRSSAYWSLRGGATHCGEGCPLCYSR